MEKIRIQDDLYTHVNAEALENLVIPDDKPYTGGFALLAEEVEKTMMDEFKSMNESGVFPNEQLERACKLYALAMDTERKAKHGIAPALKALSILDEVKELGDFSRLYKALSLGGIPTPINIGADTDMKPRSLQLL